MRVREATPADLPAVMGVIDGAMLAADAEAVRERMAAGGVLVAVGGGDETSGAADGDADASEERVLGACLLDAGEHGAHVDAIAVRRRRRGQGIGTALVEAAADRAGRVTAAFDVDVRPFYESLGFVVEETGDGRCRGVLEPANDGDTGSRDAERQG